MSSYDNSAVDEDFIDEPTARQEEREHGDSDASGDFVPENDASQRKRQELDEDEARSGGPANDADFFMDDEDVDEDFEVEDSGTSGSGGAENATSGFSKRQLGGFKATLKNPNVSEDAKETASEKLRSAGVNA